MSKIGRTSEQNRFNFEELLLRKIGSFSSTFGTTLMHGQYINKHNEEEQEVQHLSCLEI